MKKYLFLISILSTAAILNSYSQAPAISYSANLTFDIGAAITPVTPANSGGAVPATYYGRVITFAGSSTQRGFLNGTGTAATFNNITRLTLDTNLNLFVVDRDNTAIRKITPAGIVTTFATGFSSPNGIIADRKHNCFYVADAGANLIMKVSSTGVDSVFAGGGNIIGLHDGTGRGAGFYHPYDIAIDQAGNLYVADSYDNAIRKITQAAVVTTIAGNGSGGFADGTGAAASFNLPAGVNMDAKGNIYVADYYNNRIRKVTPAGVVTTIAGSGNSGLVNGKGTAANFTNPAGVAVDKSGNIYVADALNNVIRKIDTLGNVTTLSGSGSAGATDGLAAVATFNHPNDVEVNPNGFLYVTDYGNSIIRKVYLTGYTIDKALPAGLAFNPTTGIISGTPKTLTAATTYTITAYNAFGSSKSTVNVSVVNPPAVNYGIADFDPRPGQGIIYSSDNPAVATIVNNKVHIVGAGIFTLSGVAGTVKGSQVILVNKVPLVISPNNVSRNYGEANPAFTGNYVGFVNSDGPANLTAQPVFATTATPTSVPGNYAITVGGAASNNYNITYVAGTLTVNQLPSVTYGIADFDPRPGQGITYSSSNTTIATVINNKIHIVGTGIVTISGTVGSTTQSQALMVNKAPLTITANNQTKSQGSTNPALTVGYTGFVYGESVANLITLAVATTTATTTSPAGTYPITAAGAKSNNYAFNYVPGKLTIKPDSGSSGVAKNNFERVSINNLLSEPGVRSAISPNGDGVNDVLTIDNIQDYPNNKLTIVSSMGAKVFEIAGYNNTSKAFDGRSNLTGAKQQPGTYYYMLQYTSAGAVKYKTGYVVLKY